MNTGVNTLSIDSNKPLLSGFGEIIDLESSHIWKEVEETLGLEYCDKSVFDMIMYLCEVFDLVTFDELKSDLFDYLKGSDLKGLLINSNILNLKILLAVGNINHIYDFICEYNSFLNYRLFQFLVFNEKFVFGESAEEYSDYIDFFVTQENASKFLAGKNGKPMYKAFSEIGLNTIIIFLEGLSFPLNTSGLNEFFDSEYWKNISDYCSQKGQNPRILNEVCSSKCGFREFFCDKYYPLFKGLSPLIMGSNTELIKDMLSHYGLEGLIDRVNKNKGAYEIISGMNLSNSNPSCRDLDNFLPKSIKPSLFRSRSMYVSQIEDSNVFRKLCECMKAEPHKGMYDILNDMIEPTYEKLTRGLPCYTDAERIKNSKPFMGEIDTSDYIDMAGCFVKKMTPDKMRQLLNIASRQTLDITLYMRYLQFDYPEIAEAILLFVEKYIEDKHSKAIGGVRVFGRFEGMLPNSHLYENSEVITAYNGEGAKFSNSVLTGNSVQFHMSHGTYVDTDNPSILSSGVRINFLNKVGGEIIRLPFDLKEREDNHHVCNLNLETILEEVFEALLELERVFDRRITSVEFFDKS